MVQTHDIFAFPVLKLIQILQFIDFERSKDELKSLDCSVIKGILLKWSSMETSMSETEARFLIGDDQNAYRITVLKQVQSH